MAKQNLLPNGSEYAQMETDNLYKEFEPDANEIMFGQKTLPDRPLTMKEESKRKKIIMKLVDQKLKFKLIELMGRKVAIKQNNEHKSESSAVTVPNDSQPSHTFTGYQPQSTWTNSSGWQQHCPVDWQSPIYPPHHETIGDESWSTNCSFQPNIQGNFQYFHQSLNSNKPFKRNYDENPNLIRPVIDANKISNNQISTKTSVDMGEGPMNKKPAFCSSLISINCNQNSLNQSKVIQPHTKNQLLATAQPILNIAKPHIPKKDQIFEQPVYLSANSNAIEEKSIKNPSMPRRRRRYGRGTKLTKQIKASANEIGNVVLGDKFGLRCVHKVTSDVATGAHGIWNEINRLVTTVFRKEVNQLEPLSSFEQKLHNKFVIEMSTSPDVLRSDRDISQLLSRAKLEEMISKGKMILEQVKQSDSQVQIDFTQFRDKLITDSKAMNDETRAANETENVQLIHTKINEIVDSLFVLDADDTERNKLISQLVTNPRELETSKVITRPIPDGMNVMRDIKRILDEHMMVRPGKRFYIPIHRIIDVPFVVTVHERSGRMTEENLKVLLDTLIAKVESVVAVYKPKIIDPKMSDGSLVMVCANRKTFDLIKTTISSDFNGKWTGADLTVTPAQIKNPLPRSELKTILIKFGEPQFYHFNNLMLQLKIDNPSLLARRWELHEPPAGKVIDSTEEIYVGVDMESLGPIEQMNRVAVLLKSTVTFEICYDDSERNYLPDHALLAQ